MGAPAGEFGGAEDVILGGAEGDLYAQRELGVPAGLYAESLGDAGLKPKGQGMREGEAGSAAAELPALEPPAKPNLQFSIRMEIARRGNWERKKANRSAICSSVMAR